MSDLSSTSYCKDNKCDNGMNPMFLILMLLFLGGNGSGSGNCLFGGMNGNSSCGSNDGLTGILPILLILLLSGGSF